MKRVAIVGGDGSEWVVAATIAKSYSKRLVEVVVLEGRDSHKDVAISGVQSMALFHSALGITEVSFMKACAAGFKLGTRYKDWAFEGQDFLHSLAAHGAMFESFAFHQLAHRLRAGGETVFVDEYSLAAVAAKRGRFAHPASIPTLLGAPLEYSYHVSFKRYIAFLKAVALKAGVQGIRAELADAAIEEQTIVSISTSDGATLPVDIVIDCSGEQLSDLAQAVGSEWQDWTRFLPFDTVLQAAGPGVNPDSVTTELTLEEGGWVKKIPLGDELVIEHWRSSAGSLSVEPPSTLLRTRLAPGKKTQFWRNNYLAIGYSAGFCGRELVPSVHLMQSAALRFVDLFPSGQDYTLCSKEYNRITSAEHDRIRDMHCLHYVLAREQSNGAHAPEVPPELLQKLNLFDAAGKVAFYENETCLPELWISLLLGSGRWPSGRDALVDQVDIDGVRSAFTRMKAAIKHVAEQMPRHDQYLRHYLQENSDDDRSTI